MDETTAQLVAQYETPQSVIERLRNVKAVILTGITAAGKDTIMNDMLDDGRFVKVITSTTRDPRVNNGVMEQDGVDYYFLTIEQATQKIADGEYIEVANVHGRIYGSLVAEYERINTDGKIAMSNVDYQGAVNFLDFAMPDLLVLFIVPPSFEVWIERLAGRNGGSLGDDKDEIISRFRSAEKELAHALQDPRFVPVMNFNSDDTAKEIIDFAVNGTRPTPQSVVEAHQVIQDLSKAITDYIAQLET
jgi:guanylate kinase